jgi:hypothetical protein
VPPGPPGLLERMLLAKRLADTHSILSAKALAVATDRLRHAVEQALPDADGAALLQDWLSAFEALRYSLDRAPASDCHLVAFFAQVAYLRLLAELPGHRIEVVKTILTDLAWATGDPLVASEGADDEGGAALAAFISVVDPRLSRRSSVDEIIRCVEVLHADRKELGRAKSALAEERERSLKAASASARTLAERKRVADRAAQQLKRLKRLVVYASVAAFLGGVLVAAPAAVYLARW